jgi:hypothetical protein
MEKFSSFLDEAAPKKVNVLKTASFLHNNYDEALTAAKRMSAGHVSPNDRVYILKYKYWNSSNTKKFTVIFNRTLVSQAPNWEQKGYTIIAWVSPTDGVVVRTHGGKYIKQPTNS